jgi:hypothetical protein
MEWEQILSLLFIYLYDLSKYSIMYTCIFIVNLNNSNILPMLFVDFRWGEVIPLIFIRDLVNTKVIVLSQPSRRYNQSVSMIPELIELG